jgi:hypothetical protein
MRGCQGIGIAAACHWRRGVGGKGERQEGQGGEGSEAHQAFVTVEGEFRLEGGESGRVNIEDAAPGTGLWWV